MDPTIDRAKIHLTMNVDAQGNPSGGGGGGGGDATAANQVTGNASLASMDTKLTTVNTELGATNESAAGTDTSTSGLNGLLKRLLQRVTIFITNLGDVADTAWTSGNGSAISLLKRIATVAQDTNPTSVTSPAPSTGTIAIASSASLSAAITANGKLAGLITPTAWTAADITFEVSTDNSTFVPLFDSSGAEVKIPSASIPTAASRAFGVKGFENLIGWTYVKVRSGVAGTAVNQAASRTITYVLAG